MTLRFALLLLLVTPSVSRGEEVAKGYVESFKNHLEYYSHALLICNYKDYMVDEPRSKLYQRYYQEATVVRVFKGDSKVSRRLKFFLMIEGKPDLKLDQPGELSFVFFNEMPDGELLLGTGDGFRFNEEFLKLAEAKKKSSEQDGARQPATAPKSKPRGKEKSKPEPKRRSQ